MSGCPLVHTRQRGRILARRHRSKGWDMEAEVSFVDSTWMRAQAKDLVVKVGLPPARGGDPGAYGPFDMLLCALATCTAAGARAFLQERGFALSEAGLRIHAEQNEATHLLENVAIDILVPEDFPEKYEEAILRAAGGCPVRTQLGLSPQMRVVVSQHT